MQWAYYTSLRRLEPLVNETRDKDFLKTWRYFQTSDHLYYMFTAGGGPGEVHSYFSPFGSPTDAFVTAQSAILDFENRVRLASVVANEPFLFYTGVGEKYYTGVMAWSLQGFGNALTKVTVKVLEFHDGRGDFEKWAEKSLHDKPLVEQLKRVRQSKASGEKLRNLLAKAVESRFVELYEQTRGATQFF
jgi:alpha-amylase